MSFTNFDLSEALYSGLKDVRYEVPTPIQEQCIPLVLAGKDVIGAAQTGTGKTGAFVIPLMEKILKDKNDHTQALILTPTRELAKQIDEQIFALGYHTGITSAIVIGGSDFSEQVKAIRAGVDIIVATPGRLLDQMNVLNLDFTHLKYLVLDEADRMLDMGFLPDVTKIVESLPENRQTLLFSATMPDEIQKVVNKIMKSPEKVEIEASKPAKTVDQQTYFVPANKRLQLIEELFDDLDWSTALIFTATKRGTDQLEKLLKKRNVKAVSMHGDRSQEERNEALQAFKNKTFPVMVATDVLARGIDIDNVSLIINYDVPNSPDDYIHRIGRTGRYDKTGTAITFVTKSGQKYYHAIKEVIGDQISVKDLPDSMNNRKKEKKKTEDKSEKSFQPQNKQDRTSLSTHQEPDNNKTGDVRQESDNTVGDTMQDKQPEKPKQDKRRRSQKRQPAEPENVQEDFVQPDIIEKAVARNKRARKPSKGIWGIIKSFIPKISSR